MMAATILPGVILTIVLAVCFAVGLAVAASRGYRMPVAVCLALIILGGLVVVAPIAFSFLLQAIGRTPQFSGEERLACWIAGAIMCIVGILASIFARGSTNPPK